MCDRVLTRVCLDSGMLSLSSLLLLLLLLWLAAHCQARVAAALAAALLEDCLLSGTKACHHGGVLLPSIALRTC